MYRRIMTIPPSSPDPRYDSPPHASSHPNQSCPFYKEIFIFHLWFSTVTAARGSCHFKKSDGIRTIFVTVEFHVYDIIKSET